MANTINVNQNNNTVSLQDNNRQVVVTDNNTGTTINVTQPVTSIVTVSALGPQGAVGPQGPAGEIPSTGSFVLTSSFNSYTGSSDSQFAGTASFAVTASYLDNYVEPFPYTGSALITGSLTITGSITVSSSLGGLSEIGVTDGSGLTSINFSSRRLKDTNGVNVVDWQTNLIKDRTNINSLHWGNRLFYDVSGSKSIDWAGRTLLQSDGSTITIDWENGIFTGSLHGTSSYANFATSASYAISASHEIVKEVSSSYADFAESASYAVTASYLDSYVPPFPFVGDAVITGSLTISGSANVFKFDQTALVIGKEAGNALTSFSVDNTLLGYRAGFQTSTGDRNVLIGDQAGYVGDHTQDVAIGYRAGSGYTGGQNVSIGHEAGLGAVAASAEKHNTQIGAGAGRNNWRGSGNTFIGFYAGYNGYDNEGCIIIGSGSLGGPNVTAGGLTQQLRIGNGNIHIISGSLITGDIIFPSTASATYFVGDGSQLTGIDTGSWDGQYSGSAYITGSLQISSSGNQQLTLIGSGSSQPIFRVQGSEGELFSITDSLSGSLFAINNISGLPILEVFSDDRIIQGDYTAPMLTTTVKNTISAVGAFTVYELPTASYDGAFFEYTARSGSNARAGQIMSIWSGSQVNFTETTTTDFGSTTGLAFTMIVTGSNFALTGSVTTADWTIKTIVRSI